MAVSKRVLRGVRYAFGRGMDPRTKDGVRAHPFVLVAGMLLHTAIGAAILCLVFAALGLTLPSALRIVLLCAHAVGAVGGLALLVRRLREPVLQAISVADDYASNLLAVAFVVTAACALLTPRANGLFFFASAVLAIYAPFGKIRHCVLFFITRARFGAFIGTRGVLVRRSHG